LVLVGGYATSSFDFPRFSVDLDLVIREKDVQRFKELLEKEDFKLTLEFGVSPLIRSDPFVLVWNDPWDARLISWQF
jgi:predicted nucleotidyltransferase component of viral defense system